MRASMMLSLLGPCCLVSATPAATKGTVTRQVNILEDALLLDSPAFTTSDSSTSKTGNFRVSTFIRQPDDELSKLIDETIIPQLLDAVPGLDLVGDALTTFMSRIKPFLAIPNGDELVTLHVPECTGDKEIELGKTDKESALMEANADLGECDFGDDNTAEGVIEASNILGLNVEDVKHTIFFSPPKGWGVISDIDDTIKDSSVNDPLKLVTKTFLEPYKSIANMDKLFSALSSSLSTSGLPAQFIYLTGSPLQLYPALQPFVHSTFPAGPLIVRNFTFSDIPSLIKNPDDSTMEYKLTELRKIHDWYPQKKHLLIGDSTQGDPEAYGASFREFGDGWAACVWIRLVDGSDNSQERFEKAFDGVPKEKWRLFKDPIADGLLDIDLAGGSC